MCWGLPTAEASCRQHQGLACHLHAALSVLKIWKHENTFHADLCYQMKLLVHTTTATDFGCFC